MEPSLAGDPVFQFDEAWANLLSRQFAAANIGLMPPAGTIVAAKALLDTFPAMPQRAKPALIHLLSLLPDKRLVPAMHPAVLAWNKTGRYHPEPWYNAGVFFEKLHMTAEAIGCFSKAVALPGYEQQETVIRSLAALGTLYANQGYRAAARKYLWKAISAAQQNNWGSDFIQPLIQLLQP